MTDEELRDKLTAEGYEVVDTGESFYARNVKEGGMNGLDADNLSDALFEACSLYGIKTD